MEEIIINRIASLKNDNAEFIRLINREEPNEAQIIHLGKKMNENLIRISELELMIAQIK